MPMRSTASQKRNVDSWPIRNRTMRLNFIVIIMAFMAIPATADEKPVRLKQAPGLDKVEANCGACHSLDYIPMNSPFLNVDGWDAEVAKMINAFAAPIDQADAKVIADYLKKNYGLPAVAPSTAPPGHAEVPIPITSRLISSPGARNHFPAAPRWHRTYRLLWPWLSCRCSLGFFALREARLSRARRDVSPKAAHLRKFKRAPSDKFAIFHIRRVINWRASSAGRGWRLLAFDYLKTVSQFDHAASS
jgi:sulfite dehydrogenase (cytochrome) subunit B